MLRPGIRRRVQSGVNLIELIIVMVILGVLLAAGLPLIAEGLRDSKLRAAAESLVSGLRVAQSEALKRNATVRFQLVTSLADTCAVSATGAAWVTSVADATGKCNLSDSTADPFPVRRDASIDGGVRLAANGNGVFCFSGLGRPATGAAGCNNLAAQRIDVSLSGATCRAAGGDARCLRVLVSTSGAVRMCDPSVTSAQDPRTC